MKTRSSTDLWANLSAVVDRVIDDHEPVIVTRERIRQIEAKALRKLKHPSRSRKLRSFLDQ